MRIVVTGGAVIRDNEGRILLQRRSDYGDWGLPGGAMEPGESVEETMKREVYEETGLVITESELYSVYSGSRMEYKYPDGNEVVFVMFIFNAKANLSERLAMDGITLEYKDPYNESLRLEFKHIEEIEIESISTVKRPVIEDLKGNVITNLNTILRT